ncbi:MAG: right-handed parallel beta-helix repeat-containing protein [Sedimentisphaerales bacterium]
MMKINLKILVAVCVFMMTLAGSAGAVTHYVSPGQSIQAAIEDANNGDEIEVAPGTYNEAVNFNGKAIRLYSSGGQDITTIDGTGNYHVVQCVNGEDANTILEGFTITGGNANGIDAFNQGGGMYNHDSSSTVKNCTFTANSAGYGGGMLNDGSSPTVTDCTFIDNTATNFGGGMENYNGGSPTVTNCLFSGNTAEDGGGMINNGCSPTVTNCTFSGNTASTAGGGMYNYTNSSPTVTNCILWGNTPDEIFNNGGSATVNYSDVEGGWGGTGNIDADPLFVNAAGSDLRLSSSASPCVDAGNNSVPGLPATDLVGNPRVWDGDGDGNSVVDMGSYEFGALKRIRNTRTDLMYAHIQMAIDDSEDGDEIEVAPGTYNEAIDFKGKAVRLYSSGGPEITTIDAIGLSSSVVRCISGEGLTTILEGFTITGGTGTLDDFGQLCGGGMRNENSSPTVTNCIFTSNSAEFGGGLFNYAGSAMVSDCTFTNNTVSHWGAGLYNNNSNSTVINCTFSGNEADQNGGGIHNREGSSPTIKNCTFIGNSAGYGAGMYNVNYSSPTVTDCNFTNNIADQSGGGMYNNDDSNSIVTNCTFSDNTATNVGGGMCNRQSNPTVTDCTFTVNSATNAGGGIYNYYNNMTLIRCTFTGNTTTVDGGGAYNAGGSSTITDCIFSSNSADYGGGMYNFYDSSPTITNCVFLNNTATGLSAGAEGGGGMLNQNSATPTLINCVFRGNNEFGICNLGFGGSNQATVVNCILWADTPNEIYDSVTSSTTVRYSDIEGGYGGTGNIDADPCFVDANNPDPNLWNLRLKPDSPCIDAGDSTILLAVPIYFDLDGKDRYVDIDSIDDTGSEPWEFLDMGAYEFQCSGIPGDINCDGMVDFKDLAILCGNWLAGTEPEL